MDLRLDGRLWPMKFEERDRVVADLGEEESTIIDDDGFDLTLIQEMLKKSPQERLEMLQQALTMTEMLRGAYGH